MIQKYFDPGGKVSHTVRCGPWQIDTSDWSLARRDDESLNHWRHLFALRCITCRALTIGCKSHWFCGLCESCRVVVEIE
jgi:hypothetical protein